MEYITSEIHIYISLGLIIFLLISLIWNIRLEIKIKTLMRGKKGNSLEDSFISFDTDIKNLQKFKKELEEYLQTVEKRIQRNVAGVSNINFNAFSGAESGGKSFATAFVNEKKDGVIISSLHARDRLSVFTKEIKNGKCDIELSQEEQDALTKAFDSCKV